LALKFELVTMLRSGELRAACRPELIDLNGANPRFDIPAKRVKKRRVIQQPLSGSRGRDHQGGAGKRGSAIRIRRSLAAARL
jgi:hypothetical protein